MDRTTTEIHSDCELACQILEKTNDGNDLSPEHLKLLEMAVNGILNDRGKQAFRALHKQVTEGNYVKPWFMGIKHVTVDHEGYVYWKGVQVEHFTLSIKDNDWKKDTEELAALCLWLEKQNIEVNSLSYLKHCLDKPVKEMG